MPFKFPQMWRNAFLKLFEHFWENLKDHILEKWGPALSMPMVETMLSPSTIIFWQYLVLRLNFTCTANDQLDDT